MHWLFLDPDFGNTHRGPMHLEPSKTVGVPCRQVGAIPQGSPQQPEETLGVGGAQAAISPLAGAHGS